MAFLYGATLAVLCRAFLFYFKEEEKRRKKLSHSVAGCKGSHWKALHFLQSSGLEPYFYLLSEALAEGLLQC
jgi:hypothetical protein